MVSSDARAGKKASPKLQIPRVREECAICRDDPRGRAVGVVGTGRIGALVVKAKRVVSAAKCWRTTCTPARSVRRWGVVRDDPRHHGPSFAITLTRRFPDPLLGAVMRGALGDYMSISISHDEEVVRRAVALLRQGELVAIPTETVYGLAGDACSDDAVARIFSAKGRPRFNPLICHVHTLDVLRDEVKVSEQARLLADSFWPGPLTLVMPRRSGGSVSLLASAGLDTLAVRVPQHPMALEILRVFRGPLVAPSANRSGHISPTKAEHVVGDLGTDVSLVVDGGPCTLGLESTVVDVSVDPPEMLRPGWISRSGIERIVGPLRPGTATDGSPKSPGLLARHYAPTKPLRLDVRTVESHEALLAFGSSEPSGAYVVHNLSPAGNLIEAAANLFSMLRELDRSAAQSIAVMPIPGEGLAEAIRDRLRRAAAPP